MKTFLCLLLIPLVSTSCDFPSYLQGSWIYKDVNDSIVDNYYNSYRVKVTGGLLEAKGTFTIADALKLFPFNWTCLQDSNSGNFIVRVNTTGFMCVQFVQRAESVVQIKTSETKSTVGGVTCDAFNLDPWPLLRSRFRSYPCPSIGGFWADFYDKNNKLITGKSVQGAQRMEFECTKHEGIYMYSYLKEDKHLFQKYGNHLSCRGAWKEGKFTFIATGNPKITHNAIIRYNTNEAASDKFDVYIFRDAVATTMDVPDSSMNFVKASLYRETMDSLCHNDRDEGFCETHGCDHHSLSDVCKKFCGKCSVNDSSAFCEFKNSFRPFTGSFFGEWTLSGESNNKVMMNNDWINFTNYESFRCGKARFDNNLVKLSNNGCKPRYNCLHLKRKSASVITYILGRPSPRKDIGLCSHSKYMSYNQDVSEIKYFPIHKDIYRIMVNAADPNPVSCDLKYQIYIQMNISSEVQCDVILSPVNDTLLKFEYSNCTDGRQSSDVLYTCLYSTVKYFPGRSSKALWVVMSQSDPKTYKCVSVTYMYDWVASKYTRGLVVVPEDECMLRDDDDLLKTRYDEQQTDPKKWLTEWQGHPIRDIVKVDSPPDPETTATTSIDDVTRGYDVSTQAHVNQAVRIQIHKILIFPACLLFYL